MFHFFYGEFQHKFIRYNIIIHSTLLNNISYLYQFRYFLKVRRTFVTSSRELKRLEGLARSPIFAMVNENISGISTIRANGCHKYIQEKFFDIHDAHSRAFWGFLSASRWIGFRMDSLMFVLVSVASILAVLFSDQGNNVWIFFNFSTVVFYFLSHCLSPIIFFHFQYRLV